MHQSFKTSSTSALSSGSSVPWSQVPGFVLFSLISVSQLFVVDCRAEPGFWERTKSSQGTREGETLRAVERVLWGQGAELDLLLVRAGIVELMRNQKNHPRTVILLFHLRRQLGLSPAQGSVQRLASTLPEPLSGLDRALALYELARLRLDPVDQSDAVQATKIAEGLADLNSALELAWEPTLRSEILLYRGFIRFLMQNNEGSEHDFQSVIGLGHTQSMMESAHFGLALVHWEKDDEVAALRFARLARDWRRHSAQVSQLPLLHDLPLLASERKFVELLEAWAQIVPSASTDQSEEERIEIGLAIAKLRGELRLPFAVIAEHIVESPLAEPRR